jgi:predicted acyl esterase
MQNPHLIERGENRIDLYPLPEDVCCDHDVGVRMRDSVRLSANVYRPREEGRYPVIMAISPYGKDDFYGYGIFLDMPGNTVGTIKTSDHTSFEAPDPGYWVPAGYVVIQVDTRGQGLSEGDFDSFSETEQRDYCELIDWAARQPWSDGNVGLCGVSFLAITQWGVAQHHPEQLKAIIPWEGWNEPYHRKFFGGIPEVKFRRFVREAQVTPHHNPNCGYVEHRGDDDPDNHPFLDDYWRKRTPSLEKIEVPALICASFSDQELHTRDTFTAFNRISSTEKWLYNHRQPKWHAFYSEEALSLQRKFLDHFLKGLNTGIENEPPVRLQINENRTDFTELLTDSWPPSQVKPQRRYLNAVDGSLANAPIDATSVVSYDACTGSTDFDMEFGITTDIVGGMRLRLWVEAVGSDDMDLFIAIRKFDSAGQEVFFYGFAGANSNDVVSRGYMRVSRRELDESLSSELRPIHLHQRDLLLSPGEIVPVDIEILPSGTRFNAGEKLLLTIQGHVVEPHHSLIGFGKLRNRGAHRIHTGGRYDSYLTLPVVAKSCALV